MKRLIPAFLAVAALAVSTLAGCMKVKHDLVVMPDGSGKMVLTLTMKMKGEAQQVTEAELSVMDPDEVMQKVHGLVALQRPTSGKKYGVITMQMVAYFDDINALKFMDDGEGEKAKVKQQYGFRREGETFVLDTKGNLLAEEGPERKVLDDADGEKLKENFFKAMFVGFEFTQVVTLPGKVSATEGYGSKADRTASWQISERDLQKPSDQRKINELQSFKAVSLRSEVTDAEAAAFRQELEKAKAGWPALREEMKKAAAQRK